MHKPKIRVGKKAVVKDIRAGLDDAALMRSYGLSARGLERLFAKLTAAGQISRAELDRRALRSQFSHMVELINLPESPPSRAFVSTPDAVADIRGGMGDTELMEKYSLSARGLENLFRKLVRAGALDRSDLSARQAAARFRVGAPLEGGDFPVDESPESEPGAVRILDRYRVAMAAFAGLLGGVVLSVVVLSLVYGVDLPFRHSQRSELESTVRTLQKQAQDMITILEEIIRHQALVELSGTVPQESLAEEYQQCLQNCEKSLPGPDEVDKVLVLNCKKGCMGRYSERAKKIRERFYGTERQK